MILLIDNYDSFVFNIKQYIEEITNEEILTVRNGKINLEDIKILAPSKIILSPGPKHPKDSKICLDILRADLDTSILGICLGHQAIGYTHFGIIEYLADPVHGKLSNITIIEKDGLFNGLPDNFSVMRYHSLYLSQDNFPEDLEVTAVTDDNIIMALRHKTKPIYGVQFHPESYFTDYGKAIIKNFINLLI